MNVVQTYHRGQHESRLLSSCSHGDYRRRGSNIDVVAKRRLAINVKSEVSGVRPSTKFLNLVLMNSRIAPLNKKKVIGGERQCERSKNIRGRKRWGKVFVHVYQYLLSFYLYRVRSDYFQASTSKKHLSEDQPLI